MKPVARAIHTENAKVYICGFDDPFNIPKQKWLTQTKRNNYNKAKAYDNSTTIDDNGVTQPGETHAVRFDNRRLFATRSLRPRLWEYLALNAHRAECLTEFPIADRNTQIIFNFKQSGPYVMKVDRESGKFSPAVQVPELKHDHGETDTSVFYWMLKELVGRAVLYKSIDSDAYPMLMKMLKGRLRENKYPMTLHTQDGKEKNVFVDVAHLEKYALPALRMTADSFMFFCVVNGTDFFARKRLLHEVRFKTVQIAVADLSRDITNTWGKRIPIKASESTIAEMRAERLKSLNRFLFHVYWDRTDESKKMYIKNKGFAVPKTYEELYLGILPDITEAIQAEAENPKGRKRKAADDEKTEEEEPKGKKRKADVGKSKSKKRKAESVDDEQKSGKDEVKPVSHTKLRPPCPSTLEGIVDDIWFNMAYWSGENNTYIRRLLYPEDFSSTSGTSGSLASSSSAH
jgi:hypothetical protein